MIPPADGIIEAELYPGGGASAILFLIGVLNYGYTIHNGRA